MKDEEFDFGDPPDNIICEQEKQKLQREISELLVVIDTLQTNLRTSESVIKQYEPDCSIFNVPSYKWCMNFNKGG